MGVQIGEIVPKRELSFKDLRGKVIAIDAFNSMYQFLATIRQPDGTPLMDSTGRVTSHLSGLLYRTTNLVEEGVKPVYVFDGEPPELKSKTIEERRETRKEAEMHWKEALERGDIEEARKYAQASSKLTDEMVKESKELLDYMGIPWVQAPSEGEAQASHMVKRGDAWAVGSQDYDSLLFGASRLVRNLTLTGRRKLPGKKTWIEVKPELIDLREVLDKLGIDSEKLIILGILVGTDYNEGVRGIGPKRALDLVKRTEKELLEELLEEKVTQWREIFSIFSNPEVTSEYNISFRKPSRDKIIEFLCEERDFSRDRVEKAISRLEKSMASLSQSSLEAWFS